MSQYGYSKQLNIPFDQAVAKTITGLQENGFGILTDIDVQKSFKEKLNIDFKQYRILGACNPKYAHYALENEEEIGLLMPCNIIVYENDAGVTVSAIKPKVAFEVVGNEKLRSLASEVEEIFKRVINNL